MAMILKKNGKVLAYGTLSWIEYSEKEVNLAIQDGLIFRFTDNGKTKRASQIKKMRLFKGMNVLLVGKEGTDAITGWDIRESGMVSADSFYMVKGKIVRVQGDTVELDAAEKHTVLAKIPGNRVQVGQDICLCGKNGIYTDCRFSCFQYSEEACENCSKRKKRKIILAIKMEEL